MDNPLADDLDRVLYYTKDIWDQLRGQRIFITGGTGFFGCWLLESFAWANDKLNLNALALVLSRNPESFEKKNPHLYHHKAIQFCRGDVQSFDFPEGGFTYLIHSAVYQQHAGEGENQLSMVNEMLQGTRRVMDFCVQAKVQKALLISTGAIYGSVSPQLKKIPEDFSGSIDPALISGAYHQVRRMMESLCVVYAAHYAFEVMIARCFSFLGPYMSLNGRFAVSDFIRNALDRKTVVIKGDGKPVRSYLYAADLAVWLWTILMRGKSARPYNVGSEKPTTILELAEAIANEGVPLDVKVTGRSLPGVAPDYYVPDTDRVQSELNLLQATSFQEAITKTLRWYRNNIWGREN
jgi:nucleoside-diphosphate-sugar epimerase